ncbi:UDP-N-acetylmuramoyl-tripeptide--D-alanyl-D-alanine ligase [Marinithermus hydrothermalis]|uniref:UDP-N-acetylmuramoyl-tripeptide--D-alanyl-D-alanine ligase n=1 Tax=Marinithermus hydrothermalis (strain DSM 14884 / JCM 11576 / T1) TaxID=869210 RepID=F2NMK9_MARHT|nr:UDP-N-acetylmuramoyl-tripeptide--D-alanyl-D-alanine ligase [Marinithermus hydrothermalis]AEB12179.1 UDP-N-acetylmuramoylalanyl-D-glutamyl-2,6-diaminopimelate/D-alanyl-D-alanyl ligase [Marinithermus hydrothermalis DSM 14884]
MMHEPRIDPNWAAAHTAGVAAPAAEAARDLVWDSRQVTPGAAFVALPGTRTHGNAFIEDAVARGAAFVLTDRPHPKAVQVQDPWQALLRLGRALRDRFPGPVVGVTGSVGKTTTKEALAQGLAWPAPEGNLNTPPALARFFLHLPPQAPGAVVELGIDRVGEMQELVFLAQPTIGVLTAIAPAHLEALGSLEVVAREKSQLLQASRVRIASTQAARYLSLPEVRTYGFEEGTFQGRDLTITPEGTRFRYGQRTLHLPYPGYGPALGALAALAVAEVLGQDLDQVCQHLEALRLPPGRMHLVRRGGVLFIHDAYNANPASVRAGLESLDRFPGRKIVVLGTMKELGPQAEAYHLEAARLAARVAQRAVFVGEYAPQMARLFEGALAVTDAETARQALKAQVRPGDVIYLKASRAVGLERVLEGWDEDA